MPRVEEEDQVPKNLKPFIYHGLDLDWKGRAQALGDCFVCGKEGKLYADSETGLWDCKVCGSSGNPLTFLRTLYSESLKRQSDYELLTSSRRLHSADTAKRWGAASSAISGDWLLPGYKDSEVIQLYRWQVNSLTGKGRIYATAGFPLTLYGTHLYDPKKPVVYLAEGPWDAMALWEALSMTARTGLGLTGSEKDSLLATANVLAVPSCKVFEESWLSYFSGKEVVLLYDSDHPRKNNGSVFRDGWDGMRKAYLALNGTAASIKVLYWGPEGYDKSLPSGHDVRDWLAAGSGASARINLLATLLNKIDSAPKEWESAALRSSPTGKGLEPLECRSWKMLVGSWKSALRWTDGLNHTLPVMLAVCLSTEQVGDQLFLQVIGDAGSGKTQLCDGLLVSPFCHPVESVKGFLSGWRADQGKDYSLLTRINMKTAITPEGDVVMSSPEFAQLMSQQRRMFDGSFTQSYKTLDEDRRYTGLRTPWIMAGTLALLASDQSRLGDRFLRVFIPRPTTDEEGDILLQVFHTARTVVKLKSNGKVGSTKEENLLKAQRLTGGYVDYLRNNSGELLSKVSVDDALVAPVIVACAGFVADLRARPDPHRFREEKHDTKELPTRLTHQLTRLACCLAVVLNRPSVDEEVLKRVKQVALDTAHGQTLDIVRVLYAAGETGLEAGSVSARVRIGEERTVKLLSFLRKIAVVECHRSKQSVGLSPRIRWRLTNRSRGLCENVLE